MATTLERAPEVEPPAQKVPLAIAGKYLSLTTYRRDGSPVATPVWFVGDEGRLYVTTAAGSYKARRIRHNPAVAVAPCTARGTLRSEPVAARAAFLPESEYARVDRLMAEKYRWDRILILPLYRLATWLSRRTSSGEAAYLVVTGATQGEG